MLLQETDPSAFHIMTERFLIQTSSDPDTSKFAAYFQANYAKNCKTWAYCYRTHSGLNTNMHLERMHRTLKYVYLKGKKVKRLDKGLMCIMKLVRDKTFERLMILHKGKLSSKLVDIRSRHKSSILLTTGGIISTQCGWEISSSSRTEVYQLQEDTLECNCRLRCEECKSCIHRYSCSCLDFSVKWNMCKHVHLLCRYLSGHSLNEDLQKTGKTINLTVYKILHDIHVK